MSSFYIDFHCHPAMKPYGHSFKKTAGSNSKNRKDKNSIWHYDPPSTFDKVLNYVGTLTKFRQSDFSTLTYGNARIICASLYPIEKPFVATKKFGSGDVSDLLTNLATGLSDKRIDFIQKMEDYFNDLQEEYLFYVKQSDALIEVEGQKAKYRLVSNYEEIQNNQLLNENLKPNDPEIISVVLSIEGAHIFNCAPYLKKPLKSINTIDILISRLKTWPHPVFFMTFAHHYYNNLCGHAPSLNSTLQKISPQTEGLGGGFTELGWKVLDSLLSTKNGKRILIDVKHMSPISRAEYFLYLAKKYKDQDIPIIVSHGAVNGLHSPQVPVHVNAATAGKFMTGEINFYDNELEVIARSNGILGLQLDERRIANDGTRKKAEGNLSKREIQHEHARLMWNQIQHIGEVLDSRNLPAWNCITLGTDYDGIVDPLNGFWTAEQFPDLEQAVSKHAYNYLSKPNAIKNDYNKITVNDLMEKVMRLNGINFLQRYFK
ncbi:MAG: membrane dipeptidase [Bacteroidetes bacterium]|nr:membrane dipeptidase [Bacteroidota bacterium]